MIRKLMLSLVMLVGALSTAGDDFIFPMKTAVGLWKASNGTFISLNYTPIKGSDQWVTISVTLYDEDGTYLNSGSNVQKMGDKRILVPMVEQDGRKFYVILTAVYKNGVYDPSDLTYKLKMYFVYYGDQKAKGRVTLERETAQNKGSAH